MKKLTKEQIKQIIFDMMSDYGITWRCLSNDFFDDRVKNQETMLKTIELLKIDIENKRVIDSKNMHLDMLEEFCKDE